MAITIQQQPATVVSIPGFNELVYVVSSTNTGQTNFQYVCDIYLNDDTGALTFAGQTYLRIKTPIDPVYSSGVFQVGREIENYLTYDIGDDSYGFQKCPKSIVQVVCKFGEEYGVSSAITAYSDLATSNTAYAINASLDQIEALDYNSNSYTIGTTTPSLSTKLALTNRPSSGVVRSGENAWLSWHIKDTDNKSAHNAVIQTWKPNGILQQSYYITNEIKDVAVSVGRRVQRFPAGLKNLTLIPSSGILSGQTAVVVDATNVSRYEIYTVNESSGRTSASNWYKVSDECTDHTVYRLHFLNKLGGFDSFSFIRAHVRSTEIKREKFKRNMITRIGGGRYGYNKKDLSDVQYYTTQKDTIKVTSDWISEDDSAWLEELIASPVVFHDDPTHGLLAITIKETNYVRKQWRTDGLVNLELSFEYSNTKYRQRL